MSKTVSGSFTVDTRELKNFARQLRKLDRKTYLKMNKALRAGAQFVVDDARANASWSTKIPPTIKVKGGVTRLSIVAGGDAAPNAVPLERGSKKNPGYNRHPVFGNRNVWVNQDLRPYLLPAILKNERKIAELVVAEVNKAFEEAVIKSHE